MTIKTKLAVLFCVFFLLPFIIFAGLWYEKSTRSIEEIAVQSTEELVMQINRNLDYYFSDVKKVTIPLLTDPIVQRFIKIDPADSYEYFSVIEKMKIDLYPKYVYGREDIYGFTIVSTKGCYFSNIMIKDRIEQYMRMDPEENYRILGISVVNQTPVLTVYRKIIDSTSYQTGGAIIVDLFLDRILEIIDHVRPGKQGFVTIVDANGNYLYHPDRSKWGTPVPAEVRSHLLSGSRPVFVSGSGSGKKIIIAQRSAFTDLTLISEVPLNELTNKLDVTRNLTIVLGGAILLFAFITIISLSLSITKPLTHLLNLMKKVEMGVLNTRAPMRRDEIGRLNQGFNLMLDEIQRLIEIVHVSQMREKEMVIKQRESLLSSLQSRINPHFLYNTLEVINAYAIVAKVKPISQMTVWLSQILRYSLSHPEKIVHLSEEMNHVFTYYNIQKQRFRDLQFEVKLNPEWLEKVCILPLTIQPIVENAFTHGYEKHGRKPDYIGLFGEPGDLWFTLRIADRGAGMTAELMEEYNRAFEEITEQQMLKPGFQPFQRLGLWNVHSRLRLTFGKPYGLTVLVSGPEGTVLEIKLPYASQVAKVGDA